MNQTASSPSIFEPPAGHAAAAVESFRQTYGAPRGITGWLGAVDSTTIARRYLLTAFVFFLAGGLQALLLRVQLGSAENTFLDPATYNQIFTMHGTTMMFLFVIPFVEALGLYLVPLLLGTRDLPFPRLTAFSYWTYLFGGLLLYASFLFGAAPDGGWFAYVPLTSAEWSPGANMDWWAIGVIVTQVAALGAAAELVVAILRMRAPGMSMGRLPLFLWAILIAAIMILVAFPPLVVGTAMLELDRQGLAGFFSPEYGGRPLLWQHLFWLFGHPVVYVLFLPASGIVSQIVQAFSRRPIVGYPLMVLALVATGIVGLGLWLHHMFTTGLSPLATAISSAASMAIAVPAGIQVFSWLATLWTGRPVWRTPLLFVIGFLFIFVLGGLTGVMLAAAPFDRQVHDTYFVVAHLHYALVGGVVFPLMAGLYYWLPKITGRMLGERLGKLNFWLMFVSFHVTFFPMHISGLLGMPRRVYTYLPGLGWDDPNLVSTIGAFGLAAGVFVFVLNFAISMRRGRHVEADPWGGDTLEWSQPSPPPRPPFPAIPVVHGRHPIWTQHALDADAPGLGRQLEALQWKPSTWRAAVTSSVLDGRPRAIVHLPGADLSPFVLAAALTLALVGVLIRNVGVIALASAGVATAVAGWFWPKRDERRALDELSPAAAAKGELPLAMDGRDANGWWGTWTVIGMLAAALVTLVASYFYLGHGRAAWPEAVPDNRLLPAIATAAIFGNAVGMAWQQRLLGARVTWLAWAPPAAGVFGGVLALYAIWHTFADLGLRPAESAYASMLLALYGFQWLLVLLLVCWQLVGSCWALLAPGDPRGRAVSQNAALVSYLSAAAWGVIAATIYLTPLLR